MSSSPNYEELAAAAWPLFKKPEAWIHRRVEKIRFLDRQTIHRQVSVDFTLPVNSLLIDGGAGSPLYAAPLFLLRRDHPRPIREGPASPFLFLGEEDERRRIPMSLFSDVSLVDGSHNRVSLITRLQSMQFASELLQIAASEALGHPPALKVREALGEIVIGSRRQRGKALKTSFSRVDHPDFLLLQASDPVFELACLFVKHLPTVCLFANRPPDHSLVKMSYVEPLRDEREEGHFFSGRTRRFFGLASERLAAEIHEVGAAGSHHIEIEIPDELQLNYLSLGAKNYTEANTRWRDLPWRQRDYSIRQVGKASRGSLYLCDLRYPRRMGRITLKLRMQRAGFMPGALAVSLFITLLLCVMAVLGSAILVDSKSEAAAVTLLLLPTIVAAYVARPGEHSVTARMLVWPKLLLLTDAALLILALFVYLTTQHPKHVPESHLTPARALRALGEAYDHGVAHRYALQGRWVGLALISCAITFMLFIYTFLWPRPHGSSHYRPRPTPATEL